MRIEPFLQGCIGSVDHDPAGILRSIDNLIHDLQDGLGDLGDWLFHGLGTRRREGFPDLIVETVLALKSVQGPALIERGALQPHDATVPAGIGIQDLALNTAQSRLLHSKRRLAASLAQVHRDLSALDATAERSELQIVEAQTGDVELPASIRRIEVRTKKASSDGYGHRGLRALGGFLRRLNGIDVGDIHLDAKELVRPSSRVYARTLLARLDLTAETGREGQLVNAQALEGHLTAELWFVLAVD